MANISGKLEAWARAAADLVIARSWEHTPDLPVLYTKTGVRKASDPLHIARLIRMQRRISGSSEGVASSLFGPGSHKDQVLTHTHNVLNKEGLASTFGPCAKLCFNWDLATYAVLFYNFVNLQPRCRRVQRDHTQGHEDWHHIHGLTSSIEYGSATKPIIGTRLECRVPTRLPRDPSPGGQANPFENCFPHPVIYIFVYWAGGHNIYFEFICFCFCFFCYI